MERKTPWLAALALVALAGTALAQGDVIAERRAGLKRMGGHMEAMKAAVDGKGEVKPLEARVDDMIAFFNRLPALFPAGSGTGDTKALPAIWQDFPKFEGANRTMLGQLQGLKTAAAAGDMAAFATAYQATGPQYCGNCHRPFRGR